MSNILWYQPAKLSERDVMLMDNRPLDGEERSKAFASLKKVADKAVGKDTPWHGILKGYYFAKGNLDATDEKGRRLCFMFITDAADGKEQLREALKAQNMRMTEETEECIDAKSKTLRTAVLVLLAVAIVAVAVAFINSNF